MLKTYSMPAEDFVALTPYPRQTRTDQHAKGLLRSMTTSEITEDVEVVAIIHVMGRVFQLDGHTRTKLWQDGLISMPKTLTVHDYTVTNWAAADRLFARFNSRANVRSTAQLIIGAFQGAGVAFNSSRLRKGTLTSVISLLRAATEHADKVGRNDTLEMQEETLLEWLDEFEIADRYFQIASTYTGAGVIAGCILSLRKHGTSAHEFWRIYSENPPYVVTSHPAIRLRDFAAKTPSKDRVNAYIETCGKALGCLDRFLAGQTSGVGKVRHVDPLQYLPLVPVKKPQPAKLVKRTVSA